MTTPDPAAPAAPSTHDQQVDRELSEIRGTLAALGARLHPAAEAHTEARLERPQLVAEQVDAALRQAEAERRREAADAEAKTFRETITADVAKLKETKPAPAVRGITAAMWGKPRT